MSKPAAFHTRARVVLQWHLANWVLWPLAQLQFQLSPEDEPRGRRQVFGDRRIANERLVLTLLFLSLSFEIVYAQEPPPAPKAEPVPVDAKRNAHTRARGVA